MDDDDGLGNIMRKPANVESSRIVGNNASERAVLVGALCAFAWATGCGGGAASAPPPSSTPAPSAAEATPSATPIASATAPSAASSSAPSSAVDAPRAAESKPTSEAKEAPASSATSAAPEASEPAVPASEILTAPKVAFLIDYANSEAKEKAQAACEKDAKKDEPGAKGECMQKARSKFQADVLLFHKGKGNSLTLTIYKRNDSSLAEVFVAPVAFANVTAHSVQLKFKGGTGARPIWKNVASPTLNLPNDYTIEFDDAEYGKLRYDAKIGFVDK